MRFLRDLKKLARTSMRKLSGGVLEDEKICFLHFEKCGGSSFRGAIRNAYGGLYGPPALKTDEAEASLSAAEEIGMNVFEYRQQLLRYWLNQEKSLFVAGHLSLNETIIDRHPEWSFVTLLRNPVDKWISHYFANKNKDFEHGKIEKPIDEYVHTERARRVGRDYVDMLTIGQKGDLENKIDNAKKALQKVDIAGVLEDVDGLEETFEEEFGVSLNFPHRNKREKMEKGVKNKEVIEKIKDLCKPNNRIYKFVI